MCLLVLLYLVKSTKAYFQGKILSQFHVLLYALLEAASRYLALDPNVGRLLELEVLFESLR